MEPRPRHTSLAMKVNEKDVTYVADLGNLELTGEERPRMVRDLNSKESAMDYIRQEFPRLDEKSIHH